MKFKGNKVKYRINEFKIGILECFAKVIFGRSAKHFEFTRNLQEIDLVADFFLPQ